MKFVDVFKFRFEFIRFKFIRFQRIRKEETRHHNIASNASNDTFLLNVDEEIAITNEWPTETYVHIYSGIMVSFLVIAATRSAIFYSICAAASQNLHDSMFHGIISTSMKFFDENPVGRILNRFTKDLGSVDELLPKTFFDAVQINLNMLGAIIVTVFTDPKLGIVLVVMGVFFVILRNIYLKCSTNMKRLEGISM